MLGWFASLRRDGEELTVTRGTHGGRLALDLREQRRDLRIAYGAQMPAMPKGTSVQDLVMHGTGEHAALEHGRRQARGQARLAGAGPPGREGGGAAQGHPCPG